MTASPDSTEVVDLLSGDEFFWAVEEVTWSGSADESLWTMGLVTLSDSPAMILLFSDVRDMVVLLILGVVEEVFGKVFATGRDNSPVVARQANRRLCDLCRLQLQ